MNRGEPESTVKDKCSDGDVSPDKIEGKSKAVDTKEAIKNTVIKEYEELKAPCPKNHASLSVGKIPPPPESASTGASTNDSAVIDNVAINHTSKTKSTEGGVLTKSNEGKWGETNDSSKPGPKSTYMGWWEGILNQKKKYWAKLE